jgi:arginine utilization regulatory protein
MDYKKLLTSLIPEMDEGIHVVDRDGVNVIYSQKMADMEKIRREDVIGKSFREVFSYIPENESTLLQALKGHTTEAQQQTFLNVYGKEITTINTTVPIWDNGEVIAAMELARDITEIKSMADRILALQEEKIAPPKMSQPKIRHYTFYDLIGSAPAFEEAVSVARRAARSEAPVFIYGETGTGKELFAQSIHYDGARKSRPFLAQNCAAIPESLLEGILFGTAKGSFTGAVDRAGLFEQANGGTLLLDEISAMPYDLQSKLLRVLQEKYIRRVGGTRDIPVDVRIIGTVNEPPEELIARNALRSDLFYRLAVINIELPPLRDRKEDIRALAERFLDKHGRDGRYNRYSMTMEALEKLRGYDYPGNVRELENIIIAATAMAEDGEILSGHIRFPFEVTARRQAQSRQAGTAGQTEPGGDAAAWPEAVNPAALTEEGLSLPERLRRIEADLIDEAMERNGGNISRAAAELGIKRQGLQYKLREREKK